MYIYVYILQCRDGFLYTGITWNIEKRINEHNQGLTPFTKNRLPIEIKHIETFSSRIEAAKREKEIKGWSRSKKLKNIATYSKKE